MKSKLIFNSLSFIGKRLSTTKYVVLIALLLLVTISCEEEEAATTGQCDAQIEVLADILLEKSTAFGANSTVSNCQAYRTSYLNLYNKMVQCGYPTSSLDSDYEFVQNLDCSIFDGGTGGGGGGTSTGNAMIWSQVDHGCGTISVTINGSTQILSSYYSSGAPSCGASGCANFTLSPGTYSVTASCPASSWNGTVTVSAGGCSRLKLN